MRAEEFIKESVSPIVYHATSVYVAQEILTSGKFELSSVTGSYEEKFAPNNYPYFLSTTRTRRGGYHDSKAGAAQGAVFVLDGNWLNSRYPGTPVDYWNDRDSTKKSPGDRAHEAEDRVFSRRPAMPIGGVKSVHLFVDRDDGTYWGSPRGASAARSHVRKAMIAAKKQGIDAYFYTDFNDWLNLNTRRAADVSKLTGHEPKSARIAVRRSFLRPWIELIQAKDLSHLSKKARDIRYNLAYSYDRNETVKILRNDLANARQPWRQPDREDAGKIIRYMQQNQLATVSDFVDHVAAKWTSNK